VLRAQQNEKDPSLLSLKRFGQDQARRTGDCQLKLCASWHSHNVYRCKNASCMQASFEQDCCHCDGHGYIDRIRPRSESVAFLLRIYTDAADANHDRYPSSPCFK
jgi:hypothetical protein